MNPRSGHLERTSWTREDFDRDLSEATEIFRLERMEEPLEAYLEVFETVQDTIEDLLEETVDLTLLDPIVEKLLSRPEMLRGLRYLTGPPISEDDLKILVDGSLSASAIRKNPEIVIRIIQLIRSGLDRRRFPWISEEREATPAERDTAIIASTALIASQRVATVRRNENKKRQEERVRQALDQCGLEEVTISGRNISTINQGPQAGQFCTETHLGGKKADLIVGLWDTRLMPIECKVSNSSTNSIKRLNREASAKAKEWIDDFGRLSIVPVAVLAGVYKRNNLEDAQDRGLIIYWSHRLGDLIDWIESVRLSVR